MFLLYLWWLIKLLSMLSFNTKIIKMSCTYLIYLLIFVILFDKSVAICAHVIMFLCLYIFWSVFKVSCNIFGHLSIDTLRSQCEDIQTHLNPALYLGPINKRNPVKFRHRVWQCFCNFADVRKPTVNPTSWQLFMSVFTFAIGDRIEYFGDLAWIVDPGGYGVGRLEAVQSQSRLLLVHYKLVLHRPGRFNLSHGTTDGSAVEYSNIQWYKE
jgi:hypothetical protein